MGSVYVSEKDIQELGGTQGLEFRNMRSGEKEELKVTLLKNKLNVLIYEHRCINALIVVCWYLALLSDLILSFK